MENIVENKYLVNIRKDIFPQVNSESFCENDIIPVRTEQRRKFELGMGILHEDITLPEVESQFFRVRLHVGMFRIKDDVPEFLALNIKANSEENILFFLEDLVHSESAVLTSDFMPSLTRFEAAVNNHANSMLSTVLALKEEDTDLNVVDFDSASKKWVPKDKNGFEIAIEDGRFVFAAAFVTPDNLNELNIVLLQILDEEKVEKLIAVHPEVSIEGFYNYEKASAEFEMYEFWHSIFEHVGSVFTTEN